LGRKFLQEKGQLNLRKYTKKTKEKSLPKTKAAKVLLELETEEENNLFQKLKAKRLEIAREKQVPPYLIFHDKTLVEMVKLMPKSLAEMVNVSGVGEAKIKQYGKVFLEVLQ
jgi:ATP-dependent DNA helicase RecQ